MAKIEARIIDLGIDGKKKRLNILENMAELVKEIIDKEAETIVAVGNDQTFTQMINVVADLCCSFYVARYTSDRDEQRGSRSVKITLGYIPIAKPNKIAKSLGIPSGELACEVLSSRLVETIDLGKVNHSYFFSSLETEGEVVLSSGRYRIIPLENQKINIYNFAADIFNASNPKDGILEAVISSPSFLGLTRDSLFPIKKIKINSQIGKEPVSVKVDQNRILKTPLSVEVLPKKLRVIVGRERQF